MRKVRIKSVYFLSENWYVFIRFPAFYNFLYYASVYLILKFLDNKLEDKRFYTE